jgi:eukaryotic-like serine/threonine-protein kinase
VNTETATILVVEYNKNSREALVQSLSKRGYEVITATDGQMALQILIGRSLDLVLLDTQMPALSGIDILRALRNNASTEALPVIMLSASAESEDTLQAFEFGANDVINRPFDLPILLARVQAQLRRKKPINRPQASQSTTNNPGIIIAGQYRVEERIGEGGFGAVFRAIRMSDNLLVAVKVLQTTLMPSQKALTRFQIEGITTRRVQHPNAVMIFDSGVTIDGLAFLVMELLHGTPLDLLIKSGPVSTKRAAKIMIPICDAVNSAHVVKIIHRDIKPSNIFLHQIDGIEIPKVLDFGLAKILDESFGENFTREGHVLGTVSYVAPERLRSQPYDGRSDIYSLGATLYELAVGSPPFTTATPDPAAVAMKHLRDTPQPPRQKQPGISVAFESLVLSMLEKDPQNRPSLAEVIQQLQPIADGPEIAPLANQSTDGAKQKIETMLLTDFYEGSKPLQNNPSVDPIAKTHPYIPPPPTPLLTPKPSQTAPEETVQELGESSILQAIEVATLLNKPPTPPALPSIPKPAPLTKPSLAQAPTAPVIKAPPKPITAPKPLISSAPKPAPVPSKPTLQTTPKPLLAPTIATKASGEPPPHKPQTTAPKPPISTLPPKPLPKPPLLATPPKPTLKSVTPLQPATKKEEI